jgi:hypothetical protein
MGRISEFSREKGMKGEEGILLMMRSKRFDFTEGGQLFICIFQNVVLRSLEIGKLFLVGILLFLLISYLI